MDKKHVVNGHNGILYSLKIGRLVICDHIAELRDIMISEISQLLLPGKSHGWRSLVGCSPWGLKESDMTERLHFPFSLSCIGEGNGNLLQCSCLENLRDGGAWWAAVYGVAQSQTRLKRLSSRSSSRRSNTWFFLYKVFKIVKIIEAASTKVVDRV